jgi:hypothetical protein
MKDLKKHRKPWTPEEHSKIVSSGAVWNNGDVGVWKSVKDGKTTYVSNTHRAMGLSKTLPGIIKKFQFIKTTA